jgi:hypothetical protein
MRKRTGEMIPGGVPSITSPPYWGLRDYGVPGQIGLEKTREEHVAKLVEVFREVRRVLRDDGTHPTPPIAANTSATFFSLLFV